MDSRTDSQSVRHQDALEIRPTSPTPGAPTLPGWVAWRLERMEEDRFIAEALAYEITGRMAHKGTNSVRVRPAAAKMLITELLHSLIDTAEEAPGLAGQTPEHLDEQRKRDAR